MKQVIEFETKQQFLDFLTKRQIWSTYLGCGTEASCYQSSLDSLVYKIRHNLDEFVWYPLEIEDFYDPFLPKPHEIITADDIKLDSFFFPITLFTHDNHLLGYTSKCAPENLFSRQNTYHIEKLFNIDFNNVLNAYYLFLPEIEKLSKERIRIIDLPLNLGFDGNNLFAIDTWWYKKEKEDVLTSNLEELKCSIISLFETWSRQFRPSIEFQNTNLEEYFKGLENDREKIKKLYL